VSSEKQRKQESRGSERVTVGLCADCLYMRKIESARGSTFYLCGRSATDPTFPKYPRLPMLTCPGYRQKAPEEASHYGDGDHGNQSQDE
jgi:hypothetical protein